MANGVLTGKSFEYACALAIFFTYRNRMDVQLVDSPQMKTAEHAFSALTREEREIYNRGAFAAIRVIDRLEPRLSERSPMKICLQSDSEGMAGDVRDVLCMRGEEWEIGLSCKHNHDAVKHSRLSDTIDFGQEWFGKPCSEEYFQRVRTIFDPLRELRNQSRGTRPALWNEIENKEERVYIPILQSFMDELCRLDQEFPREIPAAMVKYLIGRHDFYKVIMNERRRYTEIETVNIAGTLGQTNGKIRPLIDIPVVKLPTKFYEVGFAEGSRNTVVVVCNEGWNISMRIHNASSRVEPSLKFDVRLSATPSSILAQIEPW